MKTAKSTMTRVTVEAHKTLKRVQDLLRAKTGTAVSLQQTISVSAKITERVMSQKAMQALADFMNDRVRTQVKEMTELLTGEPVEVTVSEDGKKYTIRSKRQTLHVQDSSQQDIDRAMVSGLLN